MKILLTLLLFGSMGLLFGQDLIVTMEDDSIRCRITQVKSDYIYFTTTAGMETLMGQNQVKNWTYNFYLDAEEKKPTSPDQPTQRTGPTSTSDAPANTENEPSEDYTSSESTSVRAPSRENPYPVSFAVSYGVGRELSRLPDGLDPVIEEYARDLRIGRNISAVANFYWNEAYGVNTKFTRFSTSGKLDGVTAVNEIGDVVFGSISDQLQVDFYGLGITQRFIPTASAQWLEYSVTYSLGYITTSGSWDYFGERAKTSGNTIGLNTSASANFFIGNQISLGLGLELQTGVLRELNIDYANGLSETLELEGENQISVARLNFHVGLRYHVGRKNPFQP